MSYIHNRISLWRAFSCFLVVFSSFILDFCKQFAILQILDFVSNLQKLQKIYLKEFEHVYKGPNIPSSHIQLVE